jgi:hypothetical protein
MDRVDQKLGFENGRDLGTDRKEGVQFSRTESTVPIGVKLVEKAGQEPIA